MPHIDLAFLDNFRSMSRKRLALVIIIAILIVLALYWWFHPPINIHSRDMWLLIVIFIILPTAFIFLDALEEVFRRRWGDAFESREGEAL